MDHQKKAVEHLKNGTILYGGVGSGKSMTAIAYYMKAEQPKDIYVITTAKKRDSLDWIGEAAGFAIGESRDCTAAGTITVDSWNNISKYEDRTGAFFIFDEQRLVGSGAWVKSFIRIAKLNHWILLSATPGDTWLDYAPAFIANGWYKNITDFKRQHVLYEPFSKYPKIRGYLNTKKLELLRNEILVEMPHFRHTERFLNWTDVNYNKEVFDVVFKRRWNPYEDQPIRDVAEMFRLMRRVVNTDPSRLEEVKKTLKTYPKIIVYYNFNYELDILRTLGDEFLWEDGPPNPDYIPVFELNGHKHDPVPEGDRWVYLVQYVAGAEAWNCISTNCIIMYSLTYSYKNFEQSQGRIDRLNTPYNDLYYFIFKSGAPIDDGIKRSLTSKKTFNERKFVQEVMDFDENEAYVL